MKLKSTTAVAAYYFTFFAGLGMFWPYYPLFLKERGLSAAEATLVVAITPGMGLLAPPIFGLLADALRARVWVLRALSAGAALFFFGFVGARARPVLYGTALLYSMCRAPLTTLSDTSAFEAVKRHGGSYGVLRLWGSIGFLLAALLGGLTLQHAGAPAMLIATVAAFALAAGVAWLLPAPPTESHPEVFRAWLRMLAAPDLWVLLAAIVVGQAAASTYDAGFSLRLAALGYKGTFIGVAWSIGVLSEVVFMAASGLILRRIGAAALLAGTLVVAATRWLILARLTHGAAILALQPLHGITFGCFYVSWVHLARDRAPASAPTAAQGLFGAASALGAILGTVSAGRVFQTFGGPAMFHVAAACAATAALATVAYLFAWRRAPQIS